MNEIKNVNYANTQENLTFLRRQNKNLMTSESHSQRKRDKGKNVENSWSWFLYFNDSKKIQI